jgi:adenosylcobinamide-phosphate synthase
MSFFAILFALLIEQARPLKRGNTVHSGIRAWVRWVERNLDAGKSHHAWLAWGVAVLVPAGVGLAVYWGLAQISLILAFCWNVFVLYATLGFRQFSHYFTGIREALESGDEARARELLARWQNVEVDDLPRSEVVRHVIEHSVLAAHRHVFGVLCWFSVLSVIGFGPFGAIAYRVAEFVQRYWAYQGRAAAMQTGSDVRAYPDGHPDAHPDAHAHPVSADLLAVSRAVWHAIDHFPARATAIGFAVVGSFEDAIDNWRQFAQRFPDDNDGVILAATSGAVNVRLGRVERRAKSRTDGQAERQGTFADTTPAREPQVAHLAQVVGLVWRVVVLWMVLLALFSLARLLG